MNGFRPSFDGNYPFLWRSLRRLGLQAADVDDAAQQVLSVFARRLGDIEVGAERAFLFQTAVRVASDARRAQARTKARPDEEALASAADPWTRRSSGNAATSCGPTPC